MKLRPIDIARKLGISTSTLKAYERKGVVPAVPRTKSQYRYYTEEHLAYFVCVREMLVGFRLEYISEILKKVMTGEIDYALWMMVQAQAKLYQEKLIAEKCIQSLLLDFSSQSFTENSMFTIHEVSVKTGLPVTTIRYWEKVGLITPRRNTENNYRLYQKDEVRQILTIHAIKLTVESKRSRYSVDKVKAQLQDFDYNDKDKVQSTATEIRKYLGIINRGQICGISALHHLCTQVETGEFGRQ
ncbi:MerR family transcriptional regulator [Clostridium estertheticum]|uniref:MerR family transcriptional regulator n=1 Tax=Clostridium estertheticum TaxID=238834 RepID=UPI001C0DF123|nr:MerR family transcriptional regulator [Clostridium estertheticum]MBU3075823.1 MerR family transcriptional regulator [Clostridium estertheticum]MBU3166060.1 MerR family transcriptional regulator [Clostridium estertheticum]